MVSTRNAPFPASPTAPKTTRKGRKSAAPAVNPAPHLSQIQTSPVNHTQVVGSRLRKRGRNEPLANNETLLPSSLSVGEQSPNAKRPKTQTSAEATPQRSRRRKEPAARNAPAEPDFTLQETALNSEQVHLGTRMSPGMNYDETFDDQHGLPEYGGLSTNAPTSLFSQGLQLRTQSLPVLDNLATQILSVTATSSYQEIFNMATAPQTGSGQQWSQLITLFSETKKLYTSEDPFLSSQRLDFSEKAHKDTIKKANMATFICSLFGGQEDVGFSHLNERFLDTFAVDGTKMLKPHAQLFLDVKTQAYISAVTSDKAAIVVGQRSKEGILNALFPPELDQHILSRRPGAAQLTPVERQFVEQARTRRAVLLEESQSEEAIEMLPSNNSWEDFLRDVHTYIKDNFDEIMGHLNSVIRRPGRPSNHARGGQRRQDYIALHTPQGDQVQHARGNTQIQSTPNSSIDIAEKAARAAHFAMENFGTGTQNDSATQTLLQGPHDDQAPSQQQVQTPQASGPPIQFHFERPLHPNVPSPPAPFFTQVTYQNGEMQGQWHPGSTEEGQFNRSHESEGIIPYPTQSAPTHVLYERARQAASTKSSQQQTPRKTPTNTPTQRRPWTSEEENALMAGLDRVKGPHWSQIHAMFGPSGTINDVLKDRSQVQLKDKARNLKLFFLKSNIEVPYYLQFVTGELKTRAPSRVAKNEAREKGMSDEDRAHVQGVMTLAGTASAMQEGDQSNLSLEDAVGVSDQNGLGLAVSSANDVNIDPSLEAQLRQAAVETTDPTLSGRYTVPTPNMIMQSLDRFSGAHNSA